MSTLEWVGVGFGAYMVLVGAIVLAILRCAAISDRHMRRETPLVERR